MGAFEIVALLLACNGRDRPPDDDEVVDAAPDPDDGGDSDDGGADASPTCDADLATDAENCGTCGHSCQGAACAGGRCEPVQLTDWGDPVEVDVDGDWVYFAGWPGVERVPASGGERQTIAAVAGARALAVQGDFVYWVSRSDQFASQGRVERARLAEDGEVETLATWQTEPCDIAVDDEAVYWTNYGTGGALTPYSPGSVMMLPNGADDPIELAAEQTRPCGVAADDEAIYWTNFGSDLLDPTDGTIMRIEKNGAGLTVLADAQAGPRHLAADATHVYWTSGGTFEEGNRDGTVARVAKTGGPVEVLAAGQDYPEGIAVDSTHAYWANQYGQELRSVAASGGSTSIIAAGDRLFFAVAVDAARVYWTTGEDVMTAADGGLWMIVK